MSIVTVSTKGQVVIPAEIRKSVGLEAGQKVYVQVRNGEITIKPLPKDPIRELQGKFRGGESMTEALLKDRREDLEREEAKIARFTRASRLASK